MGEQILYDINKKKYVLFSLCTSHPDEADKIISEARKYQGIIQSINQQRGFVSSIVTLKVLIPEENALQFSNE